MLPTNPSNNPQTPGSDSSVDAEFHLDLIEHKYPKETAKIKKILGVVKPDMILQTNQRIDVLRDLKRWMAPGSEDDSPSERSPNLKLEES